jgi:hypothetical protein
MPEPDFLGLRADVESATRVPGFDAVIRRGRRVRGRDRWVRLIAGLFTIAIVVPAAVVGVRATPGGQPPARTIEAPPDQPQREPPTGTPATSLHAVAGLRIGALYAAVDVCVAGVGPANCSLQVVPLAFAAQDQRGPIVTGELRAAPTDPLSDVTLTPLSPQSLLLSGIRRDGQRAYRQVSVRGGGSEIAPEQRSEAGPYPGDRLVQIRPRGTPYYVRQSDDRLFPLKSPPDLQDFNVITSVPPEYGWWATGTDPKTRALSVAVSHDLGATWSVNGLGTRPALTDPVLVAADANTAYVFVRTSGGLQQRRTLDGGRTWHPVESIMPWPSPASGGDSMLRRFGAVSRADGSLLVWLEEPAVFLESTDRGETFHPTNGPAGPIVAVSDGFVALTDPPTASRDGRTWTPLQRPVTVPP